MRKFAIAISVCLLPITLYAQWFNFKQPGIPRRPDGKPDLTAPAPGASDGKPDLSGLRGSGVISSLMGDEISSPTVSSVRLQNEQCFEAGHLPNIT